jgi:hypothetical protein
MFGKGALKGMFESEVRCLPCFEPITFEDLEAGASNVAVSSRHSRKEGFGFKTIRRKI